METDSSKLCRFGESRVLEECHELVKKIKAKKRIKPVKQKPKIFPRIETTASRRPKQIKTKLPIELAVKAYHVPSIEEQLLRKDTRCKRLKEPVLPYYAKDTYRSGLTRNLLARVSVEDAAKTKAPEEIQDVDSQFFATIKHKIPKNKVDVRSYVHIIKSILSTRVCAGYFYDEATLVKEKFLDEKSVLNDYTSKFQAYFGELEAYMAEKHGESMRLLRLSVVATNETEKKREEVVQLESELNKIKLSLIELEDVWKSYRLYQDFLFQISPIPWRKKHDRHYDPQAENPFLKTPSRQMQTCVDKYDLMMHGKTDCLEELMILFLKDFQNINKPQLYFTNPGQIKEIFHELELKNLNSLLHLRELQEPEQVMKMGLEITNKYYAKESQNIADRLKVVEEEVGGEEQRKEEIKRKVATLLQGVLRRLVASKEILRLQVFIEDVYETCVGPVDWRMSALEMVQTIENNIERQLMLLDSYSPSVVADATRQEQKATALAMRKAVEARRKVTDLDSLLQAMKRLLKRICVQPKRKIMFRSRLPQKLRKAVFIVKKEKGEEEKDDYFFTEIKMEAPSFNSLSKVALLK